MTEIPAHLMKRAEEARRKVAASGQARADEAVSKIPAHLLERAAAARQKAEEQQEFLLPGEPFNPPLSPEERERIAVILVSLRASTDGAITSLLESAKDAADRANQAQEILVKRHRQAITLAVLGTFVITVLVAALLVVLAVNAN